MLGIFDLSNGVSHSVFELLSSSLTKLKILFLGLFTFIANIDYSGTTVTLDPFIHIEQFNGYSKFAKLAKSVVARIKFRGLLSDITAHSS
jgi:hypothetical protein